MRSALALLALAPLACGITYAPGDFLGQAGGTGGPPPLLGGGTDAGDVDATSPATPEAGADAGFDGVRILLVGGHRDPLAGETGGANVTETFRTTFSSAGALGGFTVDAPPPIAASWAHAEIAAGTLYVHDKTILLRAPFADGVLGAWSTMNIKPPPGLMKPWLLDEHGFLAGPPGFGKMTYALSFLPGGGLGEWTAKTGTLSADRSEITLAHSGDLVYAIGGRNLTGGLQGDATVEVAKLDPNGELGNFTALAPLPTPVYAPIVATGPGRIVVLGGPTLNGTATNVAFAATITDLGTGALGAWAALPPLPEALSACAVVVTVNHILVFGGQRTAGTSDTILDLLLQPNGSYASSWIPIGKLPGARSGLVAVTY